MAKTASHKIITTWRDDITVGIYDSAWILRLYDDRAVLRMPYVKWKGQTGGYAEMTIRITGSNLAKLLAIAQEEKDDRADYTDRVKDIAYHASEYV